MTAISQSGVGSRQVSFKPQNQKPAKFSQTQQTKHRGELGPSPFTEQTRKTCYNQNIWVLAFKSSFGSLLIIDKILISAISSIDNRFLQSGKSKREREKKSRKASVPCLLNSLSVHAARSERSKFHCKKQHVSSPSLQLQIKRKLLTIISRFLNGRRVLKMGLWRNWKKKQECLSIRCCVVVT